MANYRRRCKCVVDVWYLDVFNMEIVEHRQLECTEILSLSNMHSQNVCRYWERYKNPADK